MTDTVTLIQSTAMTAVDASASFAAGEAALISYAWYQLGATTPATSAVAASPTPSTSLPVVDASNIAPGDYIEIGTTDAVRVEAVDPFANTLVLKEARTWLLGDLVAERSVDGVAPPAGTALSASTGVWNGTPTTLGTSPDQFIRVTDAGGLTQDTNVFDVIIIAAGAAAPLFAGPISSATFSINSGSGTFTLDVSGYATGQTAYVLTPAIPGFSINGSGVISGPTTAPGSFGAFTVSYINANGPTDSNPFTITIALDAEPLATVKSLVDQFSARGTAVSINIAALFTSATAYGSTTLPPGLSISAGGVLSGVLSVSGFYPNIVISGSNTQGTVPLPPFSWTVYESGPGYFPIDLPGLTFQGGRDPQWKTGYQEALSGKASAIGYQQYPIYQWALTFELLRNDIVPSELRRLYGLFNGMRGRVGTFLYLDKLFSSVIDETFGVGDGSKKVYQIIAAFSNPGGDGAPEIVQNLNGVPKLYDNGTLLSSGTYLVSPTGIITFTAAPALGHTLSWTGGFYYRCRFLKDSQSFSEFMDDWWECRGLGFRSVIL